MQGIIFIGLQASGKSSFYKDYFFNSHVRISLDLLNTRNKEQQFLDTCLRLQQRVVIDNTNPRQAHRQFYIDQFKARKYEVCGYYFQSSLPISLARNALRLGKEKIPKAGVLATYKQLELPNWNEGFDQLYYVKIVEGKFVVEQFDPAKNDAT